MLPMTTMDSGISLRWRTQSIQHPPRGGSGACPVADTVLLFGTHLADSASLFGDVEDWIVAEATRATRLRGNHALERALHLADQPLRGRSGNRDGTAEAGSTLLGRHTFQAGEEQLEAFSI